MTDPRIAVLSALSSPGWHPVPEAHGMPWDEAEQLLAAYDASRAAAAPSAPADRAALLREAADVAARFNSDCQNCAVELEVATKLRRMADEAQQPETRARRDVGRETVEYFLQAQQDDGTWEDASSFMDALDWAAERLAVKRVKYPDFSWRMAERTTTVTVRPLPDCLTCRHWRCNGDGPCGALLDAWQRCACTGPAAVSQPGKEA
jgi:adenine-specific DNA glycosylase